MRLFLHGAGDPEAWSFGSALVATFAEHGAGILPVAIKCRFGRVEDLALLDTGSEYSVIGGETAQLVEADLGPERGSLNWDSRGGTHRGVLHDLRMELVANHGQTLSVDGMCLVVPDWAGPNIVGFRGFLERVRLALDPAGRELRAYFGIVPAR